MFKHIEERVKNIGKRLREMFPHRVVRVVVFGSRLRAEHSEDSDIDVLIVVKNKTADMEKRIVEVFVEEELASGLPFSPVVKDLDAYEKEKAHNSPFYRAILEEAVEV